MRFASEQKSRSPSIVLSSQQSPKVQTMGEPLFDGITGGIVSFGVAAFVVLRLAMTEVNDVRRAARFDLAGHLLLGIAVSLLLYRWASEITSLPPEVRPNVWLSGTLVVVCGLGIVAAVKAVLGGSAQRRMRDLVIAVMCGAIALSVVSAWEWVLLTLTAAGVGLAMWRSTRTRDVAASNETEDRSHEPALVMIVSAALLLLLLGTWQHVIEHETHRQTRSPRYSAWPRATALRDAWERTGWTAKPQDDQSSRRVADIAAHEQRVALGLGTLLLIVAVSAWRRARFEIVPSNALNSEVSDAS